MGLTATSLLLALSASKPPEAWTQPMWADRSNGDRLSMEWLKPVIDGGDASFLSSALTIGCQAQLNKSLALVIELPMAHLDQPERSFVLVSPGYAGPDTIGFTYSGGARTSVTNPYLGLAFGLQNAWASEFGVRFPVGEGRSGFYSGNVALLAELERFPAFTLGAWSFQYTATYRPERTTGIHFHARIGTVFLTAHGGRTQYVTYRGLVGYGWPAFELDTGIVGTVLGDLGAQPPPNEWLTNQVELVARFKAWRVHPGILVRYWLDEDIRAAVPIVIGLTAEFLPGSH